MNEKITLRKPDDFHLHLRDGDVMGAVVKDTQKQFARALVMPNLKPPVTTVALAQAYRDRIMTAVGHDFEPLMSLYLTDATTPDEVKRLAESDFVHAIKLYPAGATTNSDAGVTGLEGSDAVLDTMQRLGVPLLVHGEITRPETDIFDREKFFIDEVLSPTLKRYPALKVVFEHITTKEAAEFVAGYAGDGDSRLAATITAHHLLYNRNALFQGGIRPHYYCLPILKREPHRQALLKAATSGSVKFFLGTDSAPHMQGAKENACGCAGCYTGLHAMELYAEAFESRGALDKLEAFASEFGANFYGLPLNQSTITLSKQVWQVPTVLAMPEQQCLVPLRAGESLAWQQQP
jgi:dihydroorotase